MHRHELTDEQWQRIAPLLPRERGRRARPAKLANRLFMNAVLYIAKTGAPWRDLPERFGPWKTVHNKFSRWNAVSVFDAVLVVLAAEADHESSIVDASYVRAHQHSAGGKGGPRLSVLDALAEALPPKSTLSWTLWVTPSTSTSRLETSPMSAKHRVLSKQLRAKTSSLTKATMPTSSLRKPQQKGWRSSFQVESKESTTNGFSSLQRATPRGKFLL
jgi:transposase